MVLDVLQFMSKDYGAASLAILQRGTIGAAFGVCDEFVSAVVFL